MAGNTHTADVERMRRLARDELERADVERMRRLARDARAELSRVSLATIWRESRARKLGFLLGLAFGAPLGAIGATWVLS